MSALKTFRIVSHRLLIYPILLVGVLLPWSSQAQWCTAVLVSDSTRTNGKFNDQGFVDLLEDLELKVNREALLGDGDPLTDDEVSRLNTACLVVVSRDTNSAGYRDAKGWQRVSTPLVVLNPFLVRANRWQWLSKTKVVYGLTTLVPEDYDANNPLFSDITEEESRAEKITTSPTATLRWLTPQGDETLSGVVGGATYAPVVAWWKGFSGRTFGPNVSAFPFGQEVFFPAGSHGSTRGPVIGTYNLSPLGEALFINIIFSLLDSQEGGSADLQKVGAEECTQGELSRIEGALNARRQRLGNRPLAVTPRLQWLSSLSIINSLTESSALTPSILGKGAGLGTFQAASIALPPEASSITFEDRIFNTLLASASGKALVENQDLVRVGGSCVRQGSSLFVTLSASS
jgi:hypothetical protein